MNASARMSAPVWQQCRLVEPADEMVGTLRASGMRPCLHRTQGAERRGRPSFPAMACQAMVAVKGLGVHAVDLAHQA